MAVGVFNPAAGAGLMGSGAAGSAYTEMINAGYSKNQARAYAALVGGSEAGLSYLFSGIGKLGGKVTGNVVSKLVDKAAQAYLPYINDIVKNAVLLDSYAIDSGKTKSPNSLLMHSMYAVADIGKGPEVLKLYVEEMNDPNKTTTVKRVYQLQNIEKASAVNGGVQGGTSSSLANTANAVHTVADLFAAVKAKDAAFQPKTAPKTANGKIGWDGRVAVTEAKGPKVTVGGKTYELLGYDENGSRVYQDAEVLKEQAESKQADGQGMAKNENEHPKEGGSMDKKFRELLAKAQNNDMIDLDEDMEKVVAGKCFEEIQPLRQKLSNRAVRRWYNAQDAEIPSLIDRTLDLEGQARQACDLRNENRTNARELMYDLKKRKQLDLGDPNKTFEELIADKMKRKGLSREEAMKDILDTATKTRKSVNKQLGLE